MSPDRPPTDGPASRPGAVGRPPATSRSAATNSPTSRWNSNTKTGRRCRDLFRSYRDQLGGPVDAGTLALVLAAAEAVTLAEIARQDCLGGMTGVNVELMIRLENTANRSLRRIGLAKVAKPVPLSLADQLAALGHRAPVDDDDDDEAGIETTDDASASSETST